MSAPEHIPVMTTTRAGNLTWRCSCNPTSAWISAHTVDEALAMWRQHATPERDHAEGDRLHREDVARDVACAWWLIVASDLPRDRTTEFLRGTLDRLAAAYLPDGPQDVPR